MRNHARTLAGGAALLAAGACFLALGRATDDDEAASIRGAAVAARDVQKLADSVGDPAALKKEAEAVAKKYDELTPIMWQMKPAAKGGMLIGRPGTLMNDSIELGLIQLSKRSPSAREFAMQAADLQRMAEVVRGIAEVTPYYGPKHTDRPKALKRWNSFCDDMKQGSDGLIASIKAKDIPAMQKAVARLNLSCNYCHTSCWDGGPPLEYVTEAADAVNNPVQFKEKTIALVRMFDLGLLSTAFNLRDKGGLGVGPKPGAILPDGVEGQLWELEHAPPAAAQLSAQQAELQRMAEVVRAIAEATPDYADDYATSPQAAKAWAGLSDDMKQGSDELIAAVKGDDVKGLLKAVGKVNQSCNDCHAKFRN